MRSAPSAASSCSATPSGPPPRAWGSTRRPPSRPSGGAGSTCRRRCRTTVSRRARAGRSGPPRAARARSRAWVRRVSDSRCSGSVTGAMSRPPGASCASSSARASALPAAATLMASNGARSGSPRVPSPTTSVTFSTPASARLRAARRERRAWRSIDHTCPREAREHCGVVARARPDVEHARRRARREQLAHARHHERLGDRLAAADRAARGCRRRGRAAGRARSTRAARRRSRRARARWRRRGAADRSASRRRA